MNDIDNEQGIRQQVSDLMDGELGEATAQLLGAHHAQVRQCWLEYHLIRDVLNAPELAQRRASLDLDLICTQAQESVRPTRPPVEQTWGGMVRPHADNAREAANDGDYRWKMVAGLASFAAVAAIGWSVMGTVQQPNTPMLAGLDGSATVAAARESDAIRDSAPVAVVAESAELIHDPDLDRLLRAHRQMSADAAFGEMGGFLRRATYEELER